MATDTDTSLVLSISADVAQMRRALKRMEADTNRSTRAVEKQFEQMGKSIDQSVKETSSRVSDSLSGLAKNFTRGLGVGAAAFGTRELARYADAWTVASNKIAAASEISGRQGRSLEELNKIAARTRTGITETTDLYAKLLRSTKDVAKSEEEVARATEIVNKAFKAGGAATSEQIAGILQLSQALGSGILQGDELRSVRENAPLLAQAIANEFQTTIAGLKELGAEGEITSERVFKAILAAQPEIEQAFGATRATISDSMEVIGNALTEAVGKFNDSTGASQGFAAAVTNVVVPAIIGLGEAIEETSKKHGALAADLQRFAQATGIEQGVLGAIDALKGLGREADPLVQAFQNAQGQIRTVFASIAADLGTLSDDYDKTIQSLKDAGQGGVAQSIEAEFERLNQKIKDGTFTVQDFDAVIASLVNTGNATADKLAGSLELIQAKFQSAGQVAKKSFDEAGKALADAFGTNAVSIIDTLIHKIGSVLPESVRNFGAAIRDAVNQMSNLDAATVSLPNEAPTPSRLGPDDFFAGGDQRFTDATSFLKSKAVSDRIADRVDGLDNKLSEALAQLFAQFPNVKIVSATRTFDEQKAIYDSGVRPAAKPGTSRHERGDAVDLRIPPEDIKAFAEAARQAGLENLSRIGDPGHYQLAGDKGSRGGDRDRTSQADSLDDALRSTQEATSVMAAEQAAIGATGAAFDQLTYKIELARKTQELLNIAKRDGTEATPEEVTAINASAEAYAKHKAAAEGAKNAQQQFADSQKQAAQASEQFGQIATTALNGIATALADGKIEGEELLQILFQIVQQMLTMPRPGGAGGLFGGLGGGGGGGAAGGLLGGLIIPGILHDGGKVGKDGYGHGRAVPASMFAGARKLHKGLMPDEFPAILQRGETVVPKGGYRGGGQQATHITVGVSADNNGNLMPFVESVSQRTASQTTRSGLAQYDKQLDRSFGGKMANAQMRQL